MDYSLIRIWVSWAGGPGGRIWVGLTRIGPPPGGPVCSVRKEQRSSRFPALKGLLFGKNGYVPFPLVRVYLAALPGAAQRAREISPRLRPIWWSLRPDTLFKFPRLQVEIRVFGRVRGQRRAGSSDGPGPGGLSVSDCLLPRRVAVGLKRRSQSELPAPLPLPISRAGPPARRAQNVASAGRRPRS